MPRIAVRSFVLFAVSAAVAAALGVAAGAAHGAPPANDDFSDREEIAGVTGTVSGTTLDATKEAGEPDHAGNDGGASIWYRWVAPADGRVKFTTAGSTFDTLLAVYTGNSLGSLSTVARNDDAGAAPTSDVSFTATAGVRYAIAVDGFAGKRGSVILHWGVPPANDNFADAVAISGSQGTVRGTTAEATKEEGELGALFGFGGGSVWFGWTAPSSGVATFQTAGPSASIVSVYTGETVSGLTPVVAGTGLEILGDGGVTFKTVAGAEYRIAVEAFFGAGGPFTLTWRTRPPLPNDDFTNARSLRGAGGTVRGTNVGATSEVGEPEHAGEGGGASVWYRWRAPANARTIFTTSGSRFDTVLAVYRGTEVGALTLVAANDDDPNGEGSTVTFTAVAGAEYRIALAGFAGETGRFVLSWGRVIRAGAAGAVLVGTAGPDRIFGSDRHDVIRARAGDDVVFGGAGPDRVAGGRGADMLVGGAGDDVLDGRDRIRGNDFLDGGAGRDTCLADPRDHTRRCS